MNEQFLWFVLLIIVCAAILKLKKKYYELEKRIEELEKRH